MKKDFLRIGIVGLASFAPFAAFAAGDLKGFLTNIGVLINTATPIVVALALLGFFWGLVVYIFGSSNDDKRKKGIHIMIWGIIALFVMLSVFGIINALQSTLGVGSGTVNIPYIQTNTNGGGTGTQ